MRGRALPLPPHFRNYIWGISLAVLCAASVAVVVGSLHWPLIGDASQIHYICFLMDHGVAPYRVAGDMNMPGALLLEWAVMHTLGQGALAWRCFDLLLVVCATAAMVVLAGRGQRWAGFGAGLLLLLLHCADGVNDLGERDLSIAALLLAATAAVAALRRRPRPSRLVLYSLVAFSGLCLGEACTIKPTVLLFPFFLAGASLLADRAAPAAAPADAQHSPSRTSQPSAVAVLAVGGAGFAVPCLAALALLLHERAMGAFLHDLRTLVPYYAGLDHRPVLYLLVHSVAPVLPVLVCWLMIAVWAVPLSSERLLLAAGALFGLFSYLLQAKGFPYYRYPLLAFLLPLLAMDFVATADRTGPVWRRGLAMAAVAYGALWLAPLAAVKTHRFHWWDQEFVGSLTGDLRSLHAGDGQVQCIDSISGCGTALLRLRLVQSTGVLSDFFLFGQPSAPAVKETRASFQRAVAAHPPRLVVITDGLHLHPRDRGNWSKLQRWPWLDAWLAQQYQLLLVRVPSRPVLWWSRPASAAAYRLYVRRDEAKSAEIELFGRPLRDSAQGAPHGAMAPSAAPELPER